MSLQTVPVMLIRVLLFQTQPKPGFTCYKSVYTFSPSRVHRAIIRNTDAKYGLDTDV